MPNQCKNVVVWKNRKRAMCIGFKAAVMSKRSYFDFGKPKKVILQHDVLMETILKQNEVLKISMKDQIEKYHCPCNTVVRIYHRKGPNGETLYIRKKSES